MTDILFLGTGASIPSRTRALPAVALRHGPDILLMDCGEGVQRQFMISPMSFMKVSSIFVTHMHGDHVLGLPGLLQTMGMSGRKNELLIGGPKGIGQSVKMLLGACCRSYTERDGDPANELEFPLKIVEMEDGREIGFDGYSVTSFKTDHGTESLGYVFRENDSPGKFNRQKAVRLGLVPGKDFSAIQRGETVHGITPGMILGPPRRGCRIVYTGDTAQCAELDKAAKGADVIIHESTYSAPDAELAKKHKHSTASDAAELARRSGARMLVLTHISCRYDDPSVLTDEASAIFGNTMIADDMTMLSVTRKDIRSV